MATLKVFDPPMCCSTGVCGAEVDLRLVQLASDLTYLREQGVSIERFNLRDHAQAFTEHPQVIDQMGAENEFLPIFLVNDQVMSRGLYPNREQLQQWMAFEAPSSCCSPGSGCC
jgi:hypothetical protein